MESFSLIAFKYLPFLALKWCMLIGNFYQSNWLRGVFLGKTKKKKKLQHLAGFSI